MLSQSLAIAPCMARAIAANISVRRIMSNPSNCKNFVILTAAPCADCGFHRRSDRNQRLLQRKNAVDSIQLFGKRACQHLGGRWMKAEEEFGLDEFELHQPETARRVAHEIYPRIQR